MQCTFPTEIYQNSTCVACNINQYSSLFPTSAFISIKKVVFYTTQTFMSHGILILLNLGLTYKIDLTYSILFNILELKIRFFLTKKL